MRLGPSDLLDLSGDRVLQLFTTETERVREGIELSVYRIGRHPLRLALLICMALAMQWLVTLQCIIPLIACWLLLHRESLRRSLAAKSAADQTGRDLRQLADPLRKTRIVRGYGMEEFEQAHFESDLARYQDHVSREARGERNTRAVSRVIVATCVALLAFVLGTKVLAAPSELSPAAAIFLAMAFAALARPAEMLWELRRDRSAAALAADAIYRYLDQVPPVGQAVGAKFLQPLNRTIRFENVSYGVEGRKLLNQLSFELPAGERIAIISLEPLSGRALVNLLPRFIEPQRGRVLFDGEDIAWATLESLRAETALVTADACLAGTVRENITAGRPDAPMQQVTDAAKNGTRAPVHPSAAPGL